MKKKLTFLLMFIFIMMCYVPIVNAETYQEKNLREYEEKLKVGKIIESGFRVDRDGYGFRNFSATYKDQDIQADIGGHCAGFSASSILNYWKMIPEKIDDTSPSNGAFGYYKSYDILREDNQGINNYEYINSNQKYIHDLSQTEELNHLLAFYACGQHVFERYGNKIGGTYLTDSNIDSIKDLINKGHPLYITMRRSWGNDGHAVVGVGYEEIKDTYDLKDSKNSKFKNIYFYKIYDLENKLNQHNLTLEENKQYEIFILKIYDNNCPNIYTDIYFVHVGNKWIYSNPYYYDHGYNSLSDGSIYFNDVVKVRENENKYYYTIKPKGTQIKDNKIYLEVSDAGLKKDKITLIKLMGKVKEKMNVKEYNVENNGKNEVVIELLNPTGITGVHVEVQNEWNYSSKMFRYKITDNLDFTMSKTASTYNLEVGVGKKIQNKINNITKIQTIDIDNPSVLDVKKIDDTNFELIGKIKGVALITFTDKNNNKELYSVNVRQMVDIPDNNLRTELKKLLKKSDQQEIYEEDMLLLGSLDLTKKGIKDIDGLQYAKNLTSLNLKDNQIQNLEPISKLTKIGYLDLSSNSVVDINALKDLQNLNTLYLNNNKISDFSSLQEKKWTVLSLSNTGIKDISFLGKLKFNDSLSSLSLDSNMIQDISILSSGNLSKIKSLSLCYNQISDTTSLKNLTQLTILYLYNNRISDITSFNNLTNLTNLYLSNNQISDIASLKGLTKLTTLYLAGNQITDFRPTTNYFNNLKYKDFQLNKLNKLEIPKFTKAEAQGESSIRVSWFKVPDATKYQIYYSKIKDNPNYTLAKQIDSTQIEYTISSLDSNTTYYFKIKAIDTTSKKADSEFSEIVDATTKQKAGTKLEIPQSTKAEALSESSMEVSWKKVIGATNYQIYGYNTNYSELKIIDATNETIQKCIIESLKPNTTYYFKIRAVDKISQKLDSDSSDEAHATTKQKQAVIRVDATSPKEIMVGKEAKIVVIGDNEEIVKGLTYTTQNTDIIELKSNAVVTNTNQETIVGKKAGQATIIITSKDGATVLQYTIKVIENTPPTKVEITKPTQGTKLAEESKVTVEWTKATDTEEDQIYYDFTPIYATENSETIKLLKQKGVMNKEVLSKLIDEYIDGKELTIDDKYLDDKVVNNYKDIEISNQKYKYLLACVVSYDLVNGKENYLKTQQGLADYTFRIYEIGNQQTTSSNNLGYQDNFDTFKHKAYQQMEVSGVTNGILSVKATGIDPIIEMNDIGSFDPNKYRYVVVRYKQTAGNNTIMDMFYYNNDSKAPISSADRKVSRTTNNDGKWHTEVFDMWENSLYKNGGNITGFRYDFASEQSGVEMQIDYFKLYANVPPTKPEQLKVTPSSKTQSGEDMVEPGKTLKVEWAKSTDVEGDTIYYKFFPVYIKENSEIIKSLQANKGLINKDIYDKIVKEIENSYIGETNTDAIVDFRTTDTKETNATMKVIEDGKYQYLLIGVVSYNNINNQSIYETLSDGETPHYNYILYKMVKTGTLQTPSKPEKVKATETTAILKVDGIEGATEYVVSIYDQNKKITTTQVIEIIVGGKKVQITGGGKLELCVKNLNAGTTYTMKVMAKDGFNNITSEYSEGIDVTTSQAKVIEELPKTKKTISIQWEASKGEPGKQVYYDVVPMYVTQDSEWLKGITAAEQKFDKELYNEEMDKQIRQLDLINKTTLTQATISVPIKKDNYIVLAVKAYYMIDGKRVEIKTDDPLKTWLMKAYKLEEGSQKEEPVNTTDCQKYGISSTLCGLDKNSVRRITYTDAIDETSIPGTTHVYKYVNGKNGEEVKITVGVQNAKVLVVAPEKGSWDSGTYSLEISDGIKDTKGNKVRKSVDVLFNIK